LFEIRSTDDSRWIAGGNIQIYPLSVRQVGDSRTRFRADFTAAREGELFLFVNDAMIPVSGPRWGRHDYHYFYQSSGTKPDELGNRGSACVTIEAADARERTTPAGPGGPVCEETAVRRRVNSR
jgi:hypothetical protein